MESKVFWKDVEGNLVEMEKTTSRIFKEDDENDENKLNPFLKMLVDNYDIWFCNKYLKLYRPIIKSKHTSKRRKTYYLKLIRGLEKIKKQWRKK